MTSALGGVDGDTLRGTKGGGVKKSEFLSMAP